VHEILQKNLESLTTQQIKDVFCIESKVSEKNQQKIRKRFGNLNISNTTSGLSMQKIRKTFNPFFLEKILPFF